MRVLRNEAMYLSPFVNDLSEKAQFSTMRRLRGRRHHRLMGGTRARPEEG